MGTEQGIDPTSTAQFSAITLNAPSEDQLIPEPLNADDRAAVAALPPHSALLIVQRGPNVGARFLLDTAVTTAGRKPSADIFLDDTTVSRRHAEFHATERGFEVRDQGSLNGTYVNRERIDSCPLRSGDEVQIGKYRLTFVASPNRAAQA
ncbi:MAG: FHA domain-containing protein [Buchananella hordeovulneris]|nr:FHA domain-containing protein [Buchananella hordeovulneris]